MKCVAVLLIAALVASDALPAFNIASPPDVDQGFGGGVSTNDQGDLVLTQSDSQTKKSREYESEAGQENSSNSGDNSNDTSETSYYKSHERNETDTETHDRSLTLSKSQGLTTREDQTNSGTASEMNQEYTKTRARSEQSGNNGDGSTYTKEEEYNKEEANSEATKDSYENKKSKSMNIGPGGGITKNHSESEQSSHEKQNERFKNEDYQKSETLRDENGHGHRSKVHQAAKEHSQNNEASATSSQSGQEERNTNSDSATGDAGEDSGQYNTSSNTNPSDTDMTSNKPLAYNKHSIVKRSTETIGNSNLSSRTYPTVDQGTGYGRQRNANPFSGNQGFVNRNHDNSGRYQFPGAGSYVGSGGIGGASSSIAASQAYSTAGAAGSNQAINRYTYTNNGFPNGGNGQYSQVINHASAGSSNYGSNPIYSGIVKHGNNQYLVQDPRQYNSNGNSHVSAAPINNGADNSYPVKPVANEGGTNKYTNINPRDSNTGYRAQNGFYHPLARTVVAPGYYENRGIDYRNRGYYPSNGRFMAPPGSFMAGPADLKHIMSESNRQNYKNNPSNLPKYNYQGTYYDTAFHNDAPLGTIFLNNPKRSPIIEGQNVGSENIPSGNAYHPLSKYISNGAPVSRTPSNFPIITPSAPVLKQSDDVSSGKPLNNESRNIVFPNAPNSYSPAASPVNRASNASDRTPPINVNSIMPPSGVSPSGNPLNTPSDYSTDKSSKGSAPSEVATGMNSSDVVPLESPSPNSAPFSKIPGGEPDIGPSNVSPTNVPSVTMPPDSVTPRTFPFVSTPDGAPSWSSGVPPMDAVSPDTPVISPDDYGSTPIPVISCFEPDCISPCDGLNCTVPACNSPNCTIPACDGPNCAISCEGVNCTLPCDGLNCTVPACDGSNCTIPACDGPNCAIPCEGVNCTLPCYGLNCTVPPCDGPNCNTPVCNGPNCTISACDGPNCTNPCVGPNCSLPCDGIDCTVPKCDGPSCIIPEYDGQNCTISCEGLNSTLPCDGLNCTAPVCVGPSCTKPDWDGPNCTNPCVGPNCSIPRDGINCTVAESDRPNCTISCVGSDCSDKFDNPNCIYPCNEPNCTSPHKCAKPDDVQKANIGQDTIDNQSTTSDIKADQLLSDHSITNDNAKFDQILPIDKSITTDDTQFDKTALAIKPNTADDIKCDKTQDTHDDNILTTAEDKKYDKTSEDATADNTILTNNSTTSPHNQSIADTAKGSSELNTGSPSAGLGDSGSQGQNENTNEDSKSGASNNNDNTDTSNSGSDVDTNASSNMNLSSDTSGDSSNDGDTDIAASNDDNGEDSDAVGFGI